MSLYDAAKDALRLAQQADNVDLVQKLLDVQKMALDMQEKQQELNKKNDVLEKEITDLKELKKMAFAPGHNYLVDPDDPGRMLCPVCTPGRKVPVPLGYQNYCSHCKAAYK